MNSRPKYFMPLFWTIISVFVVLSTYIWVWLDAKFGWSEGANIGAGVVGMVGFIGLIISLAFLRQSITNKIARAILLALMILVIVFPFALPWVVNPSPGSLSPEEWVKLCQSEPENYKQEYCTE